MDDHFCYKRHLLDMSFSCPAGLSRQAGTAKSLSIGEYIVMNPRLYLVSDVSAISSGFQSP